MRRVCDAIKETTELLLKELTYSPDLQNKKLIKMYEGMLIDLRIMLKERDHASA
jgi:hypothetical protein